MKGTIALVIMLTIATGHIGPAAADTAFDQKMNRFVVKSLEAFAVVPGFAIGVVRGDSILFVEGYGLRDVEKGLPVTPETGFYIASATKSFTGMTASVLATQGRLDLDAPVSRYLPDLELPEPLAAADITLRAMLTHRTGIDNRPVQRQLAFVDSLSKPDFLDLMLTRSKPMPTDFIYSNLGYNIFGYVIQEVTGETWQQVVARTVLQPVGMEHATTSIELAAQGNFAFPYTLTGATYRPEKYKSDATMHPAGGMVASASDLVRWLIVNLNDGMIDGQAALDPDAVRAAHASYASTDREYYRFRRTGYGLGWYHSDFEGELLMHHFGGIDGYHAHVSFMPEHDIGVVALVNTDAYGASTLTHMAAAYAYETLLGHLDVEQEYAEELADRSGRTRAQKHYEDNLAVAMDMLKAGATAAGTELLLDALGEAHKAGAISSGAVNNLGYSLAAEEQVETAIAVFRFNAEANPQNPNVYDSLGEAYEKMGQLALARENYAKAYEIAKAHADRNTELFKKNLDRVTAMER